MARQAQNMKKVLDEQAPHPYENPQEKDAAAKRVAEIEAQMEEGMPSVQEMKRNRQGSVHKHMKWEKRNKPFILERKDKLLRLNPDSDDPDLTSYEHLRPDNTFAYDSGAQLAGHHAMSEQAKKNWPDEMAEPTSKTAVAHLKREREPGGKFAKRT